MIKLMFVVPYGGIEWKPTQQKTINYHIERRREVGLTIGGVISMGNGHVSLNILCWETNIHDGYSLIHQKQ